MNLGKGTNILFSWFQQEEDTEGNDYGKQISIMGSVELPTNDKFSESPRSTK